MSILFDNEVVFSLVAAYGCCMARQGANLALLLLGGFRQLAEAAGAELLRRGFPEVSAANEFAMRAIAGGAGSASELGRRLAVSKQAAAKTIAVLEQRGYVGRGDDPHDARRKLLTVTPLGYDVMRLGEEIMGDLRAAWGDKIGHDELIRLEANLVLLVGASPVNLDAPGSISKDTGESID